MGRTKGFKAQGFTLVEIMLVASIIALLVSISYLSITRVLESFRQARCVHNLEQIRTAIKLFQMDHHRLPGGPEDLYPHYISSKEIFFCPSDRFARKMGLVSSYIWHNWGDAPPPKEAQIEWIPWSIALKIRGDKFPYVVCDEHPGIFIILRLNGSIEKVSEKWAREKIKGRFDSWKL